MVRMTKVGLVGLAVATAGLVGLTGTAAAAADLLTTGSLRAAATGTVSQDMVRQGAISPQVLTYHDRRLWLRVSADGVAFDGDRVDDDARLEYTVRPPDDNQTTWFGRDLTDDERNAGWAGFSDAAQRFPDGYCVSWLRLDGSHWGEWMDGRVCWEPEQPAGGQDGSQDEPTDQALSSPDPTPTRGSGQAGRDKKPEPAEPSPSPEHSTQKASPTPSQAPSPSPTPSPTRSPSASPTTGPSSSALPPLTADRADPGSAIIDSFADGESGTVTESTATHTPRPGDLTWLWVLVAGVGAAAGGTLIMLRRAT